MDDVKENIELEMCLEEEKKKCLKNIQHFYKKYGCEKIDVLRNYLTELCESIENKAEIEEIKKQLSLLDDYS
jgi:hypothetical protein